MVSAADAPAPGALDFAVAADEDMLMPAIVPSAALLLMLSSLIAVIASPARAAERGAEDTAESASTVDASTQAPLVRIATSHGDIVVELDRSRAPRTVDNFLDYVDADFYDDTLFHRVIEGFMIQGGGFSSGFQRRHTRDPIVNEADNGLSNRRYTIAMARTNAPHSATAQFFINTADNTNLDHAAPTARGWGYTVFGRVVDGHEVVDSIEATPTGPGGPFSRDAPREPVVILRAERVPPTGAGGDAGGLSDGVSGEPAPAPALPDPSEEPVPGEQRGAGGAGALRRAFG